MVGDIPLLKTRDVFDRVGREAVDACIFVSRQHRRSHGMQ